MNKDEPTDNDGPALATNRTVEIVVALLLLAGCAVVIQDSIRLGFGWKEGEGPAPGYFPFYIVVILAVSSIINLVAALRGFGRGEIFVAARPFARVLAVVVPSLVFIALIGGISIGPYAIPPLGIYVASFIFITLFMVFIGRENALRALIVGAAVPFALYMMFEKWFLVPLPKGVFGF